MGLLDKIKNVFWEEVEVDEEEEEETPVAKKVDIPKKEPKRELFKKPDPVKIMNEEEPVEQKVEEVKKPVEEISWKEWEAPIDKIENVAELGEKAVEALKKEIADSDKTKKETLDKIVEEEVKTDIL